MVIARLMAAKNDPNQWETHDEIVAKGNAALAKVEMAGRYALAQKLLILLSVSGLLLGSLFGVLGIVLVYLGATERTEVSMFGSTVSTSDSGIAAIFIAAMTFITVVTRILKAFNGLVILGGNKKF